MRYLKQFTFYPGEWAPPVVADGCLTVQLDLDALWDALELPGETGCDLIEESKYDIVDDVISELDDRIEELESANKELDTLCTRLEDENETLKEQIATLLEKLNGR